MYRKSVSFALLFFILQYGFAQKLSSFFPVEGQNGISDKNIRNINQLPDGRMVFITEGMVNVYNGSLFQYIHLDARNFYDLPGYDGFHHSYADNHGRLWIKDFKNLMVVDLHRDRFEIKPDSIFRSFGINEKISNFFMDEGKNLWLLSSSRKLIYKSADGGKNITFSNNVTSSNGTSDPLYDLAVFKNQLFLFYKSGLFVCYDLRSRKVLFENNYLLDFPPGKYKSTLYIVQGKSTMYMLRNGDGGIMLVYDPVGKNWKSVMQTAYSLNTLTIDDDQEVFVSCKDGIWTFPESLKSRQLIKTFNLIDGRSIRNEVSTLYSDLSGGFWVGTLNRGLLYSHIDRFRFRKVSISDFGKTPDDDFLVSSFCELNNRLYIGTSDGIFSKSKYMLGQHPGLNKIMSVSSNKITRDGTTGLWVCSDQGLYKLGVGKPVKRTNYPLNDLCLLDSGKLYLGTQGDGMIALHLPGNAVQKVRVNTLLGNEVKNVKQLVKWKKWLIGISDVGLFVYDPKKDRCLKIKDLADTWRSLVNFNNQQYNCIYADSKATLWIGTQDGLNVWDEKIGKVRSLYDADGLSGNMIMGIVEDSEHSIWVTTTNGVSRVKVSHGSKNLNFMINSYNQFDGILASGFSLRSAFISDAGQLFIGGRDGYNEIYIHDIPTTEKRLTPIFVSFELFGKEIRQGEVIEGEVILPTSISATKILRLKHDQNFISLKFSGLNFVNPQQTHYRYILEGIDREWQTSNISNGIGHVSYNSLPPGEYIFKVRAADNNEKWNGKITTITIVISPPWWLSWLAISSYVLIFCLISFLTFKRYNAYLISKRVKRQQQEVEQIKFSFITNLSHEIRTPLTLILTPLDNILNKLEESKLKIQLNGIYSNALNLLALVNQMLDFRRLELSGETLHLSYCEIEGVLEAVSASFEETFNTKEIEFELCLNITKKWIFIDEDKFRKILSNLLSNAVKFTPAGGKIRLSAENGYFSDTNREALKILVEDNGCGIPQQDLKSIFDRFFQSYNQPGGNAGSGIGLHLVKEYTNLHQGLVYAESNANEMTKFSLIIPSDLKHKSFVEKPAIENTANNDIRILIIEDNDDFRNFLSVELSAYYHITAASNGRVALENVFEDLPDLIISDLMMPEMDGLEFCRIIKKDVRSSHVPLIILTARSSEESQLESYDVGADAYIFKPFNLNILLLRIRNFLEQQEHRKELFKRAIILEPNTLTVNNVDEKLIQHALKCVEANLSNTTYSVEQFSYDMNMDRTGLYRKLVAIVGQTPSEFIKSVRLKKSARLILENEYNISEISLMVGFSHVSHFSKSFNDEYGVSPSQFGKEASKK